MLITKRKFFLGAALVVAPSIVRATSLMPLRGENMDPLVLAFRNYNGGLLVSCELKRGPSMREMCQRVIEGEADERRINESKRMCYQIVRKSETVGNNW
jgi:hypothetical protein